MNRNRRYPRAIGALLICVLALVAARPVSASNVWVLKNDNLNADFSGSASTLPTITDWWEDVAVFPAATQNFTLNRVGILLNNNIGDQVNFNIRVYKNPSGLPHPGGPEGSVDSLSEAVTVVSQPMLLEVTLTGSATSVSIGDIIAIGIQTFGFTPFIADPVLLQDTDAAPSNRNVVSYGVTNQYHWAADSPYFILNDFIIRGGYSVAGTATPTPTDTATAAATSTPTATPTPTSTPTSPATSTPSPSPTDTLAVPTETRTATPPSTETPTGTATLPPGTSTPTPVPPPVPLTGGPGSALLLGLMTLILVGMGTALRGRGELGG